MNFKLYKGLVVEVPTQIQVNSCTKLFKEPEVETQLEVEADTEVQRVAYELWVVQRIT